MKGVIDGNAEKNVICEECVAGSKKRQEDKKQKIDAIYDMR